MRQGPKGVKKGTEEMIKGQGPKDEKTEGSADLNPVKTKFRPRLLKKRLKIFTYTVSDPAQSEFP